MVMVKNFISALMSAISNCSLYAKDHASVDEFTRKALKILENLLKESDKFVSIILLIGSNGLIIDLFYFCFNVQYDLFSEPLMLHVFKRISNKAVMLYIYTL